MPIFLYHEGKNVGEARQVNFYDNAHTKRKGLGRPIVKNDVNLLVDNSSKASINTAEANNRISFASISSATMVETLSPDVSPRD